ncbi:MAG: hypothetical protein ACXIUW_14505 [Roseinatronobacter sp.]
MSLIQIRAPNAAAALTEAARRFGDEALIVSTVQKNGFVEVTVAQTGTVPRQAPDALPDLPSCLVLIGPPGAGVSMLAARLAAQHLRRAQPAPVRLIAPRPDCLAPLSPLVAHARLLGLDPLTPIWPDAAPPPPEALAHPGPAIIDLSGLGAHAGSALVALDRVVPDLTAWLVLPTGLHVQAQDALVPKLRPHVHALALTRADLCPLTLEDRALPQRFGLPIAVVCTGTGLMDSLQAPTSPTVTNIIHQNKDVPHVAAHISR